MSEDFLGLNDAAETRAARGVAFVSYPSKGISELPMWEKMWLSAPAAARAVLFVHTDEETGKEIWPPPEPPNFVSEGERWQKLMGGWPRVPTVEEARQFQINARARTLAAWWSRLAAARAEDEQRRPGDNAIKATGRSIGVADTT